MGRVLSPTRAWSQPLTCILGGCVWPHQYNCRISPVGKIFVKEVHTSSPPSPMPGPPSSVSSHLEELHTNAGKHELQECGYNHDIPNGSDGHEHTLHHVLQVPRNGANEYHRPQQPWGRDCGHGWHSGTWVRNMWSRGSDVG